jgi:alpha-N-arabinofuranosidase
MANLAQLVNVIAPIMTNEKGLFLQTIYFPLAEFTKQQKNRSLDVWVQAPTYQIRNRPGELKYLDVSATYNAATREVFVNVLNRSRDKDIAARLESQTGSWGRDVSVWELNHPDLKATHTFGDDTKVRPVTRTVQADVQDDSFTYTFPAHSLTILQARLSR